MKSQQQQVLEHLQLHGMITPWIAWERYNITRLAAIIHKMRNEGYIIKTEMRYRGNKQWASYKLRHEPAPDQ